MSRRRAGSARLLFTTDQRELQTTSLCQRYHRRRPTTRRGIGAGARVIYHSATFSALTFDRLSASFQAYRLLVEVVAYEAFCRRHIHQFYHSNNLDSDTG